MTHELDEDLSALIDGELPAADAARASAHAADCPQCRATLDRLKGASAAFKRSGEAPVPPGLYNASTPLSTGAVPPSRTGRRALQWVAGIAVLLGLALATAVGVKTFMPSLFSQVQGMISGAAGSLGSEGK